MKNHRSIFLFAFLLVCFSSCKKEVVNPAENSKPLINADNPPVQDRVKGSYFGNLVAHCAGDACHDEWDYNGNGSINITSNGDSISFSLFGQHTLVYAGYDNHTSQFHYNYYTGYTYADTFYYIDRCDAYFNINVDSIYIISSSDHDGMCNSWASAAKIN